MWRGGLPIRPYRPRESNRHEGRAGSPKAPLFTRQIITKMNRTMPFDSKVSLDAERETADPLVMLAQPYHLYVERVDPERNMARFYILTIEPTLFGTPRSVRRWGRIGFGGQAMEHHFDSEKDAVAMFLDLLRAKRARGYRTRPMCKARDRD